MPRAVARDRIASIQTTNERGGAEYANVDLLEALRQRGHDVLLVTNVPDIAAKTQVPVAAIDLGPKLSRSSVVQTALATPRTLWRLARALRAARPVGVTFLHFKKEQLLCALLPPQLTGRIAWAEWGPVPPSLRRGLPRLLYALAARRARAIMAVSEGTKRTVVGAGVPADKVVVVPNLVDVDEVSFDPAARERLRAEWGAGPDTLVAGCISRFQRRKRNDVVIDAMGARRRRRAARDGGRGRRGGCAARARGAARRACALRAERARPRRGVPVGLRPARVRAEPDRGRAARDRDGAARRRAGDHDRSRGRRRAAAARAPARSARPRTTRARSPPRSPPTATIPSGARREGAAGREATLVRHDPERTLQAVEQALGLRT